ncbi:MAG: dienelactone hydrolase family protein [Planctomycetia bacterium]|nr:dienelactone hydrolase family protein [Planctomycetia bacterium]
MKIKWLPILFLMFSTAILSYGSTVRGADDKMKDSENPVGQQILKTATLPNSLSLFRPGDKLQRLGEPEPIDESQTEEIKYWLFIPENESAKTEDGFPLLLFLHGMGERGDDPEKVKIHGPANILETDKAKDWPFLTISPQCPNGKYWSPLQLLKLLDEVETLYPIDKSREYVTGLSMGGFGTWMLLIEDADRFAASAPICGGVEAEEAKLLLDYPIWIFHGKEDFAVPVKYSIDAELAIQSAGGDKVKLTVYPGVGHNSWVPAYNDPELYQWFLKHINPLKKNKN